MTEQDFLAGVRLRSTRIREIAWSLPAPSQQATQLMELALGLEQGAIQRQAELHTATRNEKAPLVFPSGALVWPNGR